MAFSEKKTPRPSQPVARERAENSVTLFKKKETKKERDEENKKASWSEAEKNGLGCSSGLGATPAPPANE